MDTLKLVRLDKRRMGDFERLHARKEFRGCYCAVWTAHGPDWDERCLQRPTENLEHVRSRVVEGAHVGYLAIREEDGAVVGWAGAGPKSSFPLLAQRPASRQGESEGTWSVVCLSVPFPCRGLGYAGRIVELLVEEARRAGVRRVEAYPVEPADERQAQRGSRKFYEALGFTVAGEESEGEVRHLRMEKALG